MPIKQIGDYNIDKLIAKTEKAKKRLPTLLGNEAKNHFVAGFRIGGKKTDASRSGWKERGFSFRRNKGRAVLTQSGDLRRSIQVRRKALNRIIIGTEGIPYAEIHNEGGSITITPAMRRFFYAMMMETGKGAKGKTARIDSQIAQEARFWRGMYRHKGSKIKMPKREFIGKSRVLERKMHVIIRNELFK
jgi:phage gpG-like protein